MQSNPLTVPVITRSMEFHDSSVTIAGSGFLSSDFDYDMDCEVSTSHNEGEELQTVVTQIQTKRQKCVRVS